MRLSVIIPVYNEQDTVNDIISSVRAVCGCEIIISDADGETNKAVTDKTVIKIISPKGRANQMNAGAAAASGDAFLFLHADTRLPEDFEDEIEEALHHNDAGAFRLGLDSSDILFRIMEICVALRTRITKIPYGDQGIFCTRETFEKTGGYADIPLMEDVRFMQDIKRLGLKLYLSDKQVKTSVRRWQREGFLYTSLRNWTIISLYYLGVSPTVLKRYYK